MTSLKTEQTTDDDTAVNIECTKIAQQCRKIEREKKRIMERFQILLYRCEKVLCYVRLENKQLKLQQSSIDCAASRKKDQASIYKLREFINLSDKIMRKTEKERQKQVELDQQIRWYSEKLQTLTKLGPLNFAEHLKDCEKSKDVAENRLQKKNEKLSLLFASISKIRREIDIVCIDRRLFVEKLKQLLSELARISQDKNKIFQSLLNLYGEREKLTKKIRFVSSKGEKDRDLFDAEIKERQRINDYTRRLQVFLNVKSKNRYKHSIAPKRGEAANGQLELKYLKNFEEAFNKVGDLLGVTEVEKIVEAFESKEGQINRAVEYISVQDSDYTKIREKINQLEEQKSHTLDELKASANRFREQILRLDEKYTSVKAKTVDLVRSLRSARKVANRFLQEIKFLCSIVHFDTGSETDLDFSVFGSAAKTMMALEQRIGQIYDIYKALKNGSRGGIATEEVPKTPTNLQTDSAISEDNATTDGIDDLPSVGETFDGISTDSGNISQPINEVQLRKLIL